MKRKPELLDAPPPNAVESERTFLPASSIAVNSTSIVICKFYNFTTRAMVQFTAR